MRDKPNKAIRKHDKRHLVTMGLVLIEIGKPEEAAGFPPSKIAPALDFVSVHMYPEKGMLGTGIDTLTRCKVGKPVVIEEIFPLKCDLKELGTFIERSRGSANGLLGFYWGQTPEELKGSTEPMNQLTLGWLELFQAMNPNR